MLQIIITMITMLKTIITIITIRSKTVMLVCLSVGDLSLHEVVGWPINP